MLRAMFCQEWQMLLRTIWSRGGYGAGICWKMPTRTQNSAQNTPGYSALVVRKKGKDERDGSLQLPGDKAAMLLIGDQAQQENLHFYHKCFLVFPPHKLRPITTVSWMLLSLPSAYWAHRVDPGSRWSEGRLGYSKGLGFGFPLKQLGCRSHFRPTQSLASSPVTDRMTLSHLRGKWGRSHLEQKCNHKPFVDTGNAPRMKGDHCDGDEILLTREEARGGSFSLNRVRFGSRSGCLWMQMAGKQNGLTHAVRYYFIIIAGVYCKCCRIKKSCDTKKTFTFKPVQWFQVYSTFLFLK